MAAKKYQYTTANGANEITHPEVPRHRAKAMPKLAIGSFALFSSKVLFRTIQ